MTRAALVMMLATWSVILFFAARFFWMVLRKSGNGGFKDDE